MLCCSSMILLRTRTGSEQPISDRSLTVGPFRVLTPLLSLSSRKYEADSRWAFGAVVRSSSGVGGFGQCRRQCGCATTFSAFRSRLGFLELALVLVSWIAAGGPLLFKIPRSHARIPHDISNSASCLLSFANLQGSPTRIVASRVIGPQR